MIVVRVLAETEVAALISAFPENGAAPINRHLERFAWQQRGDVTCLAAWNGDAPVGYVFVRWPKSSGGLTEQAQELECAEVGDLFVVESARGRGAGRQLMQAAEALAALRGCSVLGLEVTVRNPHNDVARVLYQRLGYRDSGLGTFISGYTYWDSAGKPHRDEELHCYLVKKL